MSVTAFQLAGLGFRLDSGSADCRVLLPETYTPFLIEDGLCEPAARYRVLSPAPRGLPPLNPSSIYWQGHTWRLGLTANGRVGIELYRPGGQSWVSVATFDPTFAEGEICLLAGFRGRALSFALDEPFDKTILLNRLLHFGAGIIHASGVVDQGRGLIFTGRSGAGKTTLARIWRSSGARLLNDDRVIIRDSDEGAFLYSSPWHGEDPEVHAESAPLRGIFHLNQAQTNRLHRLKGAEALAALLATSVVPFYSAPSMEKLMTAWARIAETVPSFRLDFTPDSRPVELCRQELLAD